MAYFLFPLLCLWKSRDLVKLAGHPRSSYPDSGHILKEQVFAEELSDPFVSSLVQSVASFPRFFFKCGVSPTRLAWNRTLPSLEPVGVLSRVPGRHWHTLSVGWHLCLDLNLGQA